MLRLRPLPKMMTKFMTEVTAKFNPFSASAKPARLFLTHLPPNARSQGMKININTLAKSSTETSSLKIKFSTSTLAYHKPRLLVPEY